ncbi:MAG TPA: hypothetical protein VL359_00205 [bacterium]|nr:hypothetical protein [bacterium]
MATWIRFRFENGDGTLINSEETHILFKAEDQRIEVYPTHPVHGQEKLSAPICVFPCEYPEQVTAAEELIFDALAKGQSVTISQEALDEHAEYLNHVHGIRMVLQLLHEGSIRIPMEDGFTEEELQDSGDEGQVSEISQFESMLHTYLDVPQDTLRRSIAKEKGVGDSPFVLARDHEECDDHGFHEYWIVRTRPDCNYAFRDKFNDLAKSLIEKEGLDWKSAAAN